MVQIDKKSVRIRGLIFGILLCLSTAGCGEKNDDAADEKTEDITSPGWQRDAENQVTLDWYINFSWYTTPWGENAVSKAVTQETGININFMAPMGNQEEKLNALIASDSLPDLITLGWWENQVDEMIDNDMVYALNVLADEYDPYFWQVADQEVVSWYTEEDGNIYCYPNSSYVPSDYEEYENIASNQTFLVRKDMYEAIGSPDMTTPEGFKSAVEMAAEMFPEVDGYPMIPVGAHEFTATGCNSFDTYLMNFLAIPYEEDGRYYDRYTDPEYIAWLKMFRELGEEGLLLNEIFIDQRTQMDEKLARGQYFCMLYQRTDIATQQTELYARDPDSIYIAIDGPKNSSGDDPVLPGAGINGWTVTFISKNCQHPDRAIELFSYMISEYGQMRIFLGVEGVTYDMVDGVPVIREEVQALNNTDRAEYDRLYGADDTYWMFQDNVMQLQWKGSSAEPLGQMEEWTYPYSHYMGQYEVYFDSDSEAGNAQINILKLWSETLPGLLLAPTEEEFDRLLEEFTEKREQLGFEIVIGEFERQVKENRERLGMEPE